MVRKLVWLGLVAVLLFALTGCEAVRPTCFLGYDSGNDITELRQDPRAGGDYYTMPADGGQVTLLLGGYLEIDLPVQPTLTGSPFGVTVQSEFPGFPELPDDLPSPGAIERLTARVWDREDPARVLFEFDGTLEELVQLPGVAVSFSDDEAILVKTTLDVPPGVTWWMGRLTARAAHGTTGHDDTSLIAGGLRSWLEMHGGAW